MASSMSPKRVSEMSQILMVSEAEIFIQELKPHSIQQLGNTKWQLNHEHLEKLNMQAIMNASSNTDEFIKELLISYEKVGMSSSHWTKEKLLITRNCATCQGVAEYRLQVNIAMLLSILQGRAVKNIRFDCSLVRLGENGYQANIKTSKIPIVVHELIVNELWRNKVFPLILKSEFNPGTTLPIYMVLFHEVTLTSLLETIMFYKESCEAAGDSVVDLVDFCHRQIVNLIARGSHVEEPTETTKEKGKKSNLKELFKQVEDIAFNVSIKAVSILRYIIDHMSSLPLSVMTRLLNTHDIPVAFVQLIENPPWIKRDKNGKLMKFIDGKWKSVAESERFHLTKNEGQVWLSLFHLLMDPECRRKYELNTYNKTQILKIDEVAQGMKDNDRDIAFITETWLKSNIPDNVVRIQGYNIYRRDRKEKEHGGLRGYLNEVLLDQIPNLIDLQRYLEHLAVMEPPMAKKELVLEQVPEIREKLLKENGNGWGEIAKYQMKHYFDPAAQQLKNQAKIWANTYNIDSLEGLIAEPPKCAFCGQDATKRCSRCQNEWYCQRECQVNHWTKHKISCNLIAGKK